MITGILGMFLFLALVGILVQEVRVRDATLSRDTFAMSYRMVRNEYIAFKNDTREYEAQAVAKLRAVCNGLTPQPIETMLSDDVTQQLVDNFNNSKYRN